MLLIAGTLVFSQTVYKTPSGKKYHTSTCSTVKNVSHAVNIQDAKRQGLTACKVCNPGSGSNSGVNNFYGSGNKGSGIQSNEAKGTGQAVRCKATTQKGTRCKRTTRNKNGYCFQHG